MKALAREPATMLKRVHRRVLRPYKTNEGEDRDERIPGQRDNQRQDARDWAEGGEGPFQWISLSCEHERGVGGLTRSKIFLIKAHYFNNGLFSFDSFQYIQRRLLACLRSTNDPGVGTHGMRPLPRVGGDIALLYAQQRAESSRPLHHVP